MAWYHDSCIAYMELVVLQMYLLLFGDRMESTPLFRLGLGTVCIRRYRKGLSNCLDGDLSR